MHREEHIGYMQIRRELSHAFQSKNSLSEAAMETLQQACGGPAGERDVGLVSISGSTGAAGRCRQLWDGDLTVFEGYVDIRCQGT